MYSVNDTPLGWVAPFGHPRINACSRLPMAFRSVPRPSSPPGAKASTECPSHTRSARSFAFEQPSTHPPCTGTIHARNAGMNDTRPTASPTQHTLYFNAPEHCRNPALSAEPIPHGIGQTTRPDQTRLDRDGPLLRPPKPCANAPGQEATEVSCASRDAPEPDSHEQRTSASMRGARNKTPAHSTRGQADVLNQWGTHGPRWAAQARRPGTKDPIFP